MYSFMKRGHFLCLGCSWLNVVGRLMESRALGTVMTTAMLLASMRTAIPANCPVEPNAKSWFMQMYSSCGWGLKLSTIFVFNVNGWDIGAIKISFWADQLTPTDNGNWVLENVEYTYGRGEDAETNLVPGDAWYWATD